MNRLKKNVVHKMVLFVGTATVCVWEDEVYLEQGYSGCLSCEWEWNTTAENVAFQNVFSRKPAHFFWLIIYVCKAAHTEV